MTTTPADDLFEAITRGDADAVEALLDAHDGLAEARDARGVSAALTALYHRQPAIATRIADAKATLDVHEAAALGRVDRLRALLDADRGAANAPAPDGAFPLHLACFFDRPDAAALLVATGASLVARIPAFGDVQPLHSAAAAGSAAIIRLLLDAGAPVNERQAGGFTPLHAAAHLGRADLTRVLLDAGADRTLRTNDEQTARDLATAGGHDAVAAMLGGT